MGKHRLLAGRFRNDRKPTVGLNDLQLQVERQIENKVAAVGYSFEEVTCCVCGRIDFQTLRRRSLTASSILWRNIDVAG